MGNKLRWLLIVVSAMLLALLSVPVVGTAASGKTGKAGGKDVVSSGTISLAAQQDVVRYWTAERMANAKPMTQTLSGKAPAGKVSGPGGPAGTVPASAPSGALSAGGSAGSSSAAGYSYPFPFTRYEVFPASSYRIFPNRTAGKLFFSQGGGNFVCSAAAVNSVNKRLVWTAGHCVSNGRGAWSTNVLFVPARRLGVNPFGVWTAATLWSTSEWHFNGGLRGDMGAIVTNPLNGVNIVNRIGGLGFAWNWPRVQHWHDLGYPAASPFSGERMYLCTASHAVDDFPPGNGDATIGIGCDMTGGSSGGPWIFRYQGGNYLNSNNSYKYVVPAQPLAMYGPYFGNLARQLYCAAGVC